MKKKWEIIILTVIALALGIGVLSPVFSQWDGGGAFGSITNYLKQVMTSIIPNANNTYNLGAASKRFSNAYIVSANFADGTSMNTAASGASSNGNAMAVQFSDGNGAFSSDYPAFYYNPADSVHSLTIAGKDGYGGLHIGQPYGPGVTFSMSSALFQVYPLIIGWPSENMLTWESPGYPTAWPQSFFEWYVDDIFGVGPAGAKTCALMFDSGFHIGTTTQFNNYVSATPVFLSSANASTGNYVGFSLGMEGQLANASTPFVRWHSVKGNTDNSAVVTPETIPSFEIGDLGTATSLPANADNGSVVADRHLCAGEGGAANGACCFMADGKTLGHCTSLVGANGTCTCAD